jgi:hypothetical protein
MTENIQEEIRLVLGIAILDDHELRNAPVWPLEESVVTDALSSPEHSLEYGMYAFCDVDGKQLCQNVVFWVS